MTDACPSCGKTLEVYSADEGTCGYLPCGCQLERDLEASRNMGRELRDPACVAWRLAAEVKRLRERVAELEARLATAIEFDTSTWSMIHGNDGLYVARASGRHYHLDTIDAAFAKLRELGLWPDERGRVMGNQGTYSATEEVTYDR